MAALAVRTISVMFTTAKSEATAVAPKTPTLAHHLVSFPLAGAENRPRGMRAAAR